MVVAGFSTPGCGIFFCSYLGTFLIYQIHERRHYFSYFLTDNPIFSIPPLPHHSLPTPSTHVQQFVHTTFLLSLPAETANKFISGVDSACVFHNTSTRFSDGFRFGLGKLALFTYTTYREIT